MHCRVCPPAADGRQTRCCELNSLATYTFRFIFVESLTLGYRTHTGHIYHSQLHPTIYHSQLHPTIISVTTIQTSRAGFVYSYLLSCTKFHVFRVNGAVATVIIPKIIQNVRVNAIFIAKSTELPPLQRCT